MMAAIPMDKPYYCNVNANGWLPTSPQYDKTINNTGNVWVESGVDGHILQSRYHYYSENNSETEWVSGSADYIQQYRATENTQQITFSWDGILSQTGPEAGAEYFVSYELSLNVAVWHPDRGDWQDSFAWEWLPEITEDGQSINDQPGSISIDKTKTETFNFPVGTRFATWFSLLTDGMAVNTGVNYTATGDSDFYNTFTLENVTGATPVPEPITILFALFSAGLLAIKTRK